MKLLPAVRDRLKTELASVPLAVIASPTGMANATATQWRPSRPKIPVQVVLLGVVSFLTDLSSEAIFAVLPLFLVGVLGASALTVGVMEGLADFAASSLDLASGYLSDRTGRRKPLAVFGYGFSSFAKLILLFVKTVPEVVVFRVVERLGKSIRGAPRDALLAGVSPASRRGLAFGLHKAFDKAGAVIGPLVAYAILSGRPTSAETFHFLFAVAAVPAFVALAVLALTVREAPRTAGRPRPPIRQTLQSAGAPYRRYLISAGLFSLGYSSFAFLLLDANRVGFDAKDVALLYALFNASFTLVSIPLGRLGDAIGRHALIACSYLLYAATMLGLALFTSQATVVLLFILYGCFYAIDEGQTKAFISDLVPDGARATSLGIYGLTTGVLYLPASLIGGALWKWRGPSLTFGFSAVVAAIAFVSFVFSNPTRGSGGQAPPVPPAADG